MIKGGTRFLNVGSTIRGNLNKIFYQCLVVLFLQQPAATGVNPLKYLLNANDDNLTIVLGF
jgi:hypothetical protein